MKLINYSLEIGGKTLLENVNVSFGKGMNHLLGSNGVGKSCFSKSCGKILPYKGEIRTTSEITIIGSYCNIPFDFTCNNIISMLKDKHSGNDLNEFMNLLDFSNTPRNIKIKHLSDGQKQKIKLLFFLMSKPQCFVLDEFSTALDKSSINEMYKFLNYYIQEENATCINVTHNLSDLDNLPGSYFLLSNKTITPIETLDRIVSLYIKGGS